MRFVPVKDESQQAMQCIHRTRQGFIQERTATYNRLRGLVSEFGIIGPQSTDALRHIVSDQKETLPVQVRLCIDDLLAHITNFEEKIAEYDKVLSQVAKTDHRSQQLLQFRLVLFTGGRSN